MTGPELDATMRYFGALFSRFKQANSAEVLVAYGSRIKFASQIDAKQAIEELAEGSLLFPSVQELVEAVRLVAERNKPSYDPPKLAAPKEPPLVAFVRSMRECGNNRTVGPSEVRAFRIVRESGVPKGDMHAILKALQTKGGKVPLTNESYASVDEFLAHEGYAVR